MGPNSVTNVESKYYSLHEESLVANGLVDGERTCVHCDSQYSLDSRRLNP